MSRLPAHQLAALTEMANAFSHAMVEAVEHGVPPDVVAQIAMCAVADNARANLGDDCLPLLSEVVRRRHEQKLPQRAARADA